MAEAALDLVEKEQGIDLDAMEAYNLLAQGKRNLLCGEVPNAVNQLQEACRVLAAKFGETANECGEAYFTYGKALLDLSRMESGVLGNALQGIEEDDEEKSSEDKSSSDERIEKDDITEEEKEKISEEVIDAMLETDEEAKARLDKEKPKDEKENGEKTNGEEKMDEGDDKKEGEEKLDTEKDSEDKEGETSQEENEEGESEDIADDTEGDEKEEGDTEEEEGDENKEGSSEKKEEDDVSNLQLAWEMLELSKVIYKRNSDKESKIKLADTFLKLGEVGLETEQYETAIADLKECLKLQKELYDAEDRALAETHYQLGLACTFNAQYDEAISNYRSAASSIEAKIASLNKIVEDADKEGKGKEPANTDDPVVKAQKELKDLQDILPDIMAKIEDVLDEKRSADTVKKMVKDSVAADMGEQTTTGFGQQTTDKTEAAPMDITHLVRKKRKPEDECEDSTKKAKTEVNGSGDSAAVNGSAEGKDVETAAPVNGTASEVAAS